MTDSRRHGHSKVQPVVWLLDGEDRRAERADGEPLLKPFLVRGGCFLRFGLGGWWGTLGVEIAR